MYINGKGEMKGKLLSLVTLIDARDAEKLDKGALQRYLAEGVWFPTSLLPSQGVVWEGIDDSSARATITDAATTVSLEFSFNEEGEATSVYTPARYREVDGQYEPTPWKGYFSAYIEKDGYRIPSTGTVEWHLGSKVYRYWKAELSDIRYEY